MIMKLIAFQGELGAYSELATYAYFGRGVQVIPKSTFTDIFKAVSDREVDHGVIPIENSLTGSIHENYDLLLEYDLKIIGEIKIRIIHHLIAGPGVKTENIRRVLAPPQALDQCMRFLQVQNKWDLVSVNATASAVKNISESKNTNDAAIGSREASEMYGMEVIEEGIENDPRNYTRFVIVSEDAIERGPAGKSSLIYSIGNQPGALFEALKIFADNKINLVKLESRPIHGKPWEYMFYADIEADAMSDSFAPVLDELKKKTDYLKVLGSY